MAEHVIAPWSDAEVERARKMWVAGSSAGDIATSLGRTRTSVIGKVHRLGLQRSKAAAQEGHRVAGATQRLPWKAEELDILRKLASEKRPLSFIGRHLSRSKSAIHRKMVDLGLTVPEPQGQGAALKFGTPASPVPTAPSLPAARTVPAAAIPWEQRTGRECSFPFGDAKDGSLRCCPEPHLPGHPYCEAHATEPGLYAYRPLALQLLAHR